MQFDKDVKEGSSTASALQEVMRKQSIANNRNFAVDDKGNRVKLSKQEIRVRQKREVRLKIQQ